MAQSEMKSSLLESRHKAQNEIKEPKSENSSLHKKLEMLRASDVLARMQPEDRRAALAIIRQRDKHGQLDGSWLASFIRVLRALKAEESHSEGE